MAFFSSPRFVALVLSSFAAMACSDSDDPDGSGGSSGSSLTQATAASFEGIYQLTHYTSNEAGCDVEGQSRLESVGDTWFVLVARVIVGQQVLELVSCADAADCAAKGEQIRNNGIYSYDFGATLSSESSPDELGGFSASTGFEENGVCVERDYTDHLFTRTGDSVRLESRVKLLTDKPVEDGFCVVRPAESRAEAESAPCAALEVLEGTKQSDL